MSITRYSGPVVVIGDTSASGSLVGNTRGYGLGNDPGVGNSAYKTLKTVTGLANNSATAVLTVTVPNFAQAALLRLQLLASLGAGGAVGAFECSNVYANQVAIARTPGLATVATLGTAVMTAGSAVAGAATITLTVAVSGLTGGNTATQTFTLNVTIARSAGSSAAHQVMLLAEVVNATGAHPTGTTLYTGITIA